LIAAGSWPVSEYAKADPETIAKKAGDTPVTLLPDIEKYRPTKLPSIGDERDYNDEANAPWKLDPFYVVAIAVLLIFPLLLASQKFWRV
jgi:hypothetical protein